MKINYLIALISLFFGFALSAGYSGITVTSVQDGNVSEQVHALVADNENNIAALVACIRACQTNGKLPENFFDVFPKLQNATLDGVRWHMILGVDKDATQPEISQAFRKLLLKVSPDHAIRKGMSKELAENLSKLVNAAKEQADMINDVAAVFGPYTVKSQQRNSNLPEAKNLDTILAHDISAFQKKSWDECQELFKKFVPFYIKQAAVASSLMLAYYAHTYFKKKNNADPQKGYFAKLQLQYRGFAKKYNKQLEWLSSGIRGASVVGFGVYPLFKFWKLFFAADITKQYKVYRDDQYPVNLFHLDYSVSYDQGNVRVTERTKDPEGPHCYMTDDTMRDVFEPIREAKVMRAFLVLASILGFFGPMII